MSWFADLAGKAENLLNNIDEQTGAALRNHNSRKPKEFYITDNTWNPRKRPVRSAKKGSVTETRSNCSPSRSPSPPNPSRQFLKEDVKAGLKKKPNPSRKTPSYNLNHCPKTLVDDFQGDSEHHDQYGLRQRRYSLPPELDSTSNKDSWQQKIQNLEVENVMLKNELNVVSKEVSDLLGKLRKTEDGNDVVSKELEGTQRSFNSTQIENRKANYDKEILISQIEKLRVKIDEISERDESKYQEIERLNSEIMVLKHTNKDLGDRTEELLKKSHDANSIQQKLESDLRHAQAEIINLQNELTKSNAECQRLEKDWSMYKHRVKNMLHAKDDEIKCLQEGLNLTEDSKLLVEQLDSLKEERDELSEAVENVRNECNTIKQCMSQLETKYSANERVISALRDALKDERAARTRAENQSVAIAKELKTIQIETGQTIASLRTALRDKENVLNHYRETVSSVKTNDTSALNVADYDDTQDSAESEKVRYLSDILVQRQGKIDKLLADNNMLRIQLDKLESKYKSGVVHQANAPSHSVVNFNTDVRQRRVASDSGLSSISQRMAAVVKRYPAFRMFIVIYMVVLHFWVLTVLLTNTPENYIPRPKRPA